MPGTFQPFPTIKKVPSMGFIRWHIRTPCRYRSLCCSVISLCYCCMMRRDGPFFSTHVICFGFFSNSKKIHTGWSGGVHTKGKKKRTISRTPSNQRPHTENETHRASTTRPQELNSKLTFACIRVSRDRRTHTLNS